MLLFYMSLVQIKLRFLNFYTVFLGKDFKNFIFFFPKKNYFFFIKIQLIQIKVEESGIFKYPKLCDFLHKFSQKSHLNLLQDIETFSHLSQTDS